MLEAAALMLDAGQPPSDLLSYIRTGSAASHPTLRGESGAPRTGEIWTWAGAGGGR